MNLEASDITQTSVLLSWTPPENNGGSEVTHYIIEKREIDRKTWSTVKAEAEKDKIPFKVSGLIPGTEYYFRVTAVNEYGSGVPKVTPTSYLASDPVSMYPLLLHLLFYTGLFLIQSQEFEHTNVISLYRQTRSL